MERPSLVKYSCNKVFQSILVIEYKNRANNFFSKEDVLAEIKVLDA